MWYDINKTLSYNCLFNFVIGMRGVGKTYAFKKWAIKDYLKTGAQFAYVRRYKTEVNGKRLAKFFKDVSEEFPSHSFETKGTVFYIDGKVAGQAFPLSTAKIEKSVPFPEINKICFDEFILDKGSYHYLPDEVTNFLELYSTISRLRDVTVFFLSNAITVTNPYFDYFSIKLPYGGKTVARTGTDILCEVIKESEYTDAAKKTRFGALIDGTEYGSYNMENEFYRDNKNFVAKKTPGSEYYFTVIFNSVQYGIWVDYKEGLLTVSRDVDPSSLRIYALTNDDHVPNALLLGSPRRSVALQTLRNMYELGAVRFESIAVKNSFMPAMRMICRR